MQDVDGDLEIEGLVLAQVLQLLLEHALDGGQHVLEVVGERGLGEVLLVRDYAAREQDFAETAA